MRKTIEPGTYQPARRRGRGDTTKDGKPHLTINFDVDGATVRGRLCFDTDAPMPTATGAERSIRCSRDGPADEPARLVTGAERIDDGLFARGGAERPRLPRGEVHQRAARAKVFQAPTREQMLEASSPRWTASARPPPSALRPPAAARVLDAGGGGSDSVFDGTTRPPLHPGLAGARHRVIPRSRTDPSLHRGASPDASEHGTHTRR